MRLGKNLKNEIKNSIIESFGDIDIYLFGSRVDDKKQGGDIDIAIETNLSRVEFRKRKVRFLISMLKKDLDLKIDLVEFKNRDRLLFEQIKENFVSF
jgi:predicted nucleotidyltransferase